MGHQSYVLLRTETTVSNHPVVFPKSSCNVHVLRRPWVSIQERVMIAGVQYLKVTRLNTE
jgi:hypothetical protein